MPTYEFECIKCGGFSEIFKKINDPHPTICPLCNEDGLVRAFKSASNFELKGKGWFKNGDSY